MKFDYSFLSELTEKRIRLKAMWSATVMSVLVTVASCIVLAGWYFKQSIVAEQWIVAAVVGLICLLFSLFPLEKSIRYSLFFFYISLCAALVANVITNLNLIEANQPFEFLQGFKLAPIAVAIIAPLPVWVGFSVIGVCPIFVLAFYYFYINTQNYTLISAQDPWSCLIYSAVAFFVYRHRLQEVVLENRMSRLKAEKTASDNIAKVFLGLKNLINSPIQSIELTVHLMQEGKVSHSDGHEHLKKSVLSLRKLSQILNAYENEIDGIVSKDSFEAVENSESIRNPKHDQNLS